MTWYTFLLFVHVTMAVIWVGGGLMMQLFGIRAAMSGDPRVWSPSGGWGVLSFPSRGGRMSEPLYPYFRDLEKMSDQELRDAFD